MAGYFSKGKDIVKESAPTKAELEEKLALAKRNNDQESIEELERQIAAAPETVEPEVITDWSAAQTSSGSFLDDDGIKADISVYSDSFSYMKGVAITESMLSVNDRKKIGEPAISKEDAVSAAQAILYELDIDDMAAGSVEKAQLYASIEDAFCETGVEPLSKGYLIKFVRNIDGIAGITDHSVMFRIEDDFAYKAPLYPEEIQVFVNESGKAQLFVWSHPLEIAEKVTDNVKLMPFEDVKQRIRDMLTYVFAGDTSPTVVTSVHLNMAIVDVKDKPKEAMYMPAWFVYYTQTFNDPDTGEEKQQKLRLAFNAIDGGRVLEVPAEIGTDMQQAIDEQSAKYGY